MSQKINALGLRLKKRANWNGSFSTQHIAKYNKVFFNNLQIASSLSIIMTNLHIFSNKVVVKKNSKNYQIYSKLYQKSSMKYLLRDQIELLKNEKNNLRSLYINNKKTTFIACNFFFDKRASFNKIKNKQFIMLSPTIFVNYITDQLKKKGYAKQATFKTNLKAAILTFSYKILKHIQNNIAGFKIVCSGKWKKTRSGRKQQITIKFGKLTNPSIAQTILYDYKCEKTKFGVCGIKVWIAQKNR